MKLAASSRGCAGTLATSTSAATQPKRRRGDDGESESRQAGRGTGRARAHARRQAGELEGQLREPGRPPAEWQVDRGALDRREREGARADRPADAEPVARLGADGGPPGNSESRDGARGRPRLQ